MPVKKDASGHRSIQSEVEVPGPFPRELAEHALAHIVGDKAEQAYRRDSAVERRRPMMQMWAKHLAC